MTLPASGPMSLSQAFSEFALPSDSAMSALYGKGGGPASGPLKLADFYGRGSAHSPSVSPDPVSDSGSTTVFDFGSATCAVSGGVGPFSYAWVRASGDTSITANSPSLSNTSFHVTGMGPLSSKTATFRCDVTDTGNSSLVVQSNVITVTAERS